MEPLEVIDKYHGLRQIEGLFRVMKEDLETSLLCPYSEACGCPPDHLHDSSGHAKNHPKKIIRSEVVAVNLEACWSSALSGEGIHTAKMESIRAPFCLFKWQT